MSVRSPAPGVVWVFPGIEVVPRMMDEACRGYRDAGVTADLRLFDWERFPGGLANLQDYEGNRQKADDTAAKIAAWHAAHPGRTIDLVGYSGGGGMAVFVAEALPGGVRVRNVVLAQAALSPGYNLIGALRRIDGKLISFHSQRDWFILGAGTRVFGTMDRKYVESCGKVGFDVEHAVPDPALRDRLVQVEWNDEMWNAGHWGGHPWILGREWNKRFVAPHLLPAAARAEPNPP